MGRSLLLNYPFSLQITRLEYGRKQPRQNQGQLIFVLQCNPSKLCCYIHHFIGHHYITHTSFSYSYYYYYYYFSNLYYSTSSSTPDRQQGHGGWRELEPDRRTGSSVLASAPHTTLVVYLLTLLPPVPFLHTCEVIFFFTCLL